MSAEGSDALTIDSPVNDCDAISTTDTLVGLDWSCESLWLAEDGDASGGGPSSIDGGVIVLLVCESRIGASVSVNGSLPV